MASFLSTEIRDTITLYHPNWLDFNSENCPARLGEDGTATNLEVIPPQTTASILDNPLPLTYRLLQTSWLPSSCSSATRLGLGHL